MSLNFGFNVGVRSGHHRHPNTVEAAELLQESIHFLGHSVYTIHYILYTYFWPTLYREAVFLCSYTTVLTLYFSLRGIW